MDQHHTYEIKDGDSMELALSLLRTWMEEMILAHCRSKIEVTVYRQNGHPNIQCAGINSPYDEDRV